MENYLKLRVIGKGSYGEVWLVKHKRDKKQYVLKKLDVHNASKRERHAAEQEAKLLSRLKHPNIVSYKDSFETDEGQLYIAMGYCEGGDLYTRLKEQKGTSLDERQIVEWFVQIAMALQYMHERNVLHRDLKTQNIFLTKSKIIKVGDLGIARVLDHSSDMATTLIGTPYYMSPELFSNKPYNHKSDVWALGCCVYEMTTLKHAFNAKDMNALVYKILRGKMPAMPKQYSDELVTLIKAMLNHNPDRRPSVSRILRDTYIKRNIALFLESSKKEKRPVRSAQGDRSSDARSRKDEPDGSGDRPRMRKPRSSPAIVVRDEDSEPLEVGPDLAPIAEEDIGGTGDSQKSRKSVQRLASPKRNVNNHDNNGHDRRAFKPQGNTDPVLISIDSGSAGGHAKNSDIRRDPSPQQRNRGSRPRRSSGDKLNGSDDRLRSDSGDGRPSSAGGRRNSREEKVFPTSASSPSLSSKDRSPENRHNSKSVLNNPRQVAKPRPLPNREPVTPRESNKEPKASRSSRGPGQAADPGYVSGSSQSHDGANSARSDLETPRTNASARERRRERKDRETPREPVSARSVDLNVQRRSLDPNPRLARPSGSKSEDYARNDLPKQPKAYSRAENVISKSSDKSSRTDEQKLRMRQPSIDNESSESTSDGEDQVEQVHQKENKRNPGPLSKPNLVGNAPQTGLKISSPSHHVNNLRPGRDPLKALHPSPNPSTPENDSNDDEEDTGKERDMSNLISVLNTTLQMNRDKDKEEEDDEDIYADDIQPEPPGGTKFIRRPPKLSERGSDPDVSVMEVESVEGSSNKFNVNISSPGNAGIRTLTTTGRLWARITDLRKDCIRGLGVEKIKRAYDILDNFDAEELEPQLIQLFGKKDFDLFAGKIWQLKFCEEAAFGLV